MLENSRYAAFLRWFVCRVNRKVSSLKRRVRTHVVRGESKIARRCGEKHISKWKCRKIARRCGEKHIVQNTPASDHFWKFRCRKIARRCGAKHIFKWKWPKYLCLGTFFEVQMSNHVSVSQLGNQWLSQLVSSSQSIRQFVSLSNQSISQLVKRSASHVRQLVS